MKDKKIISAHVPAEVAKAIQKEADSQGRSVSWVIGKILGLNIKRPSARKKKRTS